jgi:uncharacterized protein YkwD
MRKRALVAGFVTAAAAVASILVAVTANATTNTYEAEAPGNTIAGGAVVVDCHVCSGGKKVGRVGNNAGTLIFNHVDARAAGRYSIAIAYGSSTVRGAAVTINGGTARHVSFPATGSSARLHALTITVTLRFGDNTVSFANATAWAPDFDKITVTSAATPSPSRPGAPSAVPSAPSIPTVPPTPSTPGQAPSAPPTPSPTVPPTPVLTGQAAQEAEVVVLVNQQRATAGCQPLNVDSRLAAAARGHSADMAARGYFDHTTPDGVDFATRITNAGYQWSAAAENIAKGQPDAASVMNSWMNSAGHKANILNCGYKDIGVGLAYDSGGTPLWTQDFGTPW